MNGLVDEVAIYNRALSAPEVQAIYNAGSAGKCESNLAPVADARSVTTAEDIAANITLTGHDPEGAPISFRVVTLPTHGVLTGTGPNTLSYAPALNYFGPDSFTFVVNDGAQDSAPATVSITVTAVNDSPVANPQTVTTPEDTLLPFTLTGSDVDGDTLTFGVITPPTKGSLSGTAPNLTYTPNANFDGADSFGFGVNDGQGGLGVATVNITITPVNDAPVANAQNLATPEDTALPIVLTGSDVDGDALTFAVTAPPAHGTLSGAAPNLTYIPNANFNGSDVFSFSVTDLGGAAATAAIALTVTAPPPPPSGCDLYPIALHAQSLAGKQAGDLIADILNGSQAGNFGWLTWAGSPSVPPLVASLTAPGNSGTYVNPDNSSDRKVTVGDWVQGSPVKILCKNQTDFPL